MVAVDGLIAQALEAAGGSIAEATGAEVPGLIGGSVCPGREPLSENIARALTGG